ncbi:GntR family transcriptional regulator [Krasilnikovia sp. MM14-A1259]|uniref:GntR family transcriptional regulator n=1 Tax=Krasilnikovia sp. MM14-A1259 TaxID=3373539 RepID=UPI00399C9BB5
MPIPHDKRAEGAATERRTPKYQAIAADLAARIRSGALPPGSALPPQKELSTSYGVTLATLREALRRLEDDGLLTQQAGRGTYVAEPRAAYRLDSLRGLAEDLRAQGQDVTTTVLSRASRRPDPAVAQRLALGPGRRALRLERLRLLGGRPAVHQVSWVPDPLGAALRGADLTSLYAAVAAHGVVVHRAAESIRPGLLDEPTAALLDRPAGIPVFVSERLTSGLDGGPLVLDRATILGTVMEIRTERAATGLSMQWTRQE